MSEQSASNPQADAAQPAHAADAHRRDARVEELGEIIRAYNAVTEKLQHSHESLQNEVHRLRQELASTNAQLQRSKRLSALGEMAAGIAHEIRNPLAAIQLYAGMIVQDLEDTPKPPALALANGRKIAAAVQGLNAIVNDVLSFAREIEPRPQWVPVSEIFERVLEAHRPAIEAANVQVRLSETDRAGLRIYSDVHLLHQALLNLVRNAVEAMADAPQRVLTLAALPDEAGGAMTIMVSDTGPGIAEADVDRIFNPFFTTRNTGTGLGLAIVHRIVDAHGGSTVVHNDGGAVFQITLPEPSEPRSKRGGAVQVSVNVGRLKAVREGSA